MNNDPQNPNDVTAPSDEANGSADFAEFAVTMKRARRDRGAAAPLPPRTPRGTGSPGLQPDDDFDDAITLELPVLTRREAPWLRRRRVLARSLTWVIALLLVVIAIAAALAMRAERSPTPVEPTEQTSPRAQMSPT